MRKFIYSILPAAVVACGLAAAPANAEKSGAMPVKAMASHPAYKLNTSHIERLQSQLTETF